MALFNEVTEDEDFAEEIEFTGEVRLATPVIQSCSGTPGVIFDKSARKKRTTSNYSQGDDTLPHDDTEIGPYEQLIYIMRNFISPSYLPHDQDGETVV